MPPRTTYEAELRERLKTAEWLSSVYQRLAALQGTVVRAARVLSEEMGHGSHFAETQAALKAALDFFDRESGKVVLESMPKEICEALTAPSAFEEGMKEQKEPLFAGMSDPSDPWPGIVRTLQALVDLAWRHRDEPRYGDLACSLTEKCENRLAKMEEIINELHRRFAYAADPVKEHIGPVPFEPGGHVDADEACLFVMTLAMSVEIPCRIVGARYGKARWTCFVAYQDETDTWNNVDPLRQRTDQVPNELVAFGANSSEALRRDYGE